MAGVMRCSSLLVSISLMVFTPTVFAQSVCSGSALTAYSFVQDITSPNYPSIYLSNTDCTWVITANLSSQVVVLKLIDFYLEGTSTSCTSAYDYVTIYDGSNTNSSILQKLCGIQTLTEIVSTGSSMTVSFHSDGSNNYRGFNLQYTSSDKSAVCTNSALTAYSYAQYLTSPDYPSNYLSNTDCTWFISANLSSQVVKLNLIDFNLEGPSTSCSAAYDYVAIYDGSSTSSSILQKLCGIQTTTEILSTGSSMTVRFHSDDTNNYRGFKLEYTSSDKSDLCSSSALTAYSSVQYLTSPNYPNNYLSNMDCTWVITANLSSQVVALKLIDFYLEGTSTSCFEDYVTIYDGSNTSSSILQKLCGIQTTSEIVSTGSSMTVRFHSDGSINYRGFFLQYTSSDKSAVCSSSSLTASSSLQYITSPNYPNNYLSDTDCTWVITASLSSHVVVLNLIDFFLEGTSTSCTSAYDYVTIYDGSSTSSFILQKLCGTQTTTEIVSSGSSMTVRFHSDSSNNYRGFKLQYTSSDKSDLCSSSDLTASSSVQYITSPNYPNNYLRFQYKLFHFTKVVWNRDNHRDRKHWLFNDREFSF